MTSHSPLPPFAAWAGARQPKLVLVGEAWGESEAALCAPFVGASGFELFKMLGEVWDAEAPDEHGRLCRGYSYDWSRGHGDWPKWCAWVSARDAWLASAGMAMTNVLALRPPSNKLEHLSIPKAELTPGYTFPPISRGLYLRPEYLPELSRLGTELSETNPNLILALGNTACWALLHATNIGAIRGAVALATPMPGLAPREWKVLPTYHPAGVMRQWSWRPIVIADLLKAKRECEFPELSRPKRQVIVNPELAEVARWVDSTLASPPRLLAVDTETGAGQIKCVGFARSRGEAMVVPFVDLRRAGGSYWATVGAEAEAWRQVRRLLASPIPKVFQNGMYDLQYFVKSPAGAPRALAEDTMLLHHSLFPELQKGLGFLGSIYTNEASWKLMRRRRPDTEKRDE